jgi:hypothetical protein
VTKSTTGTADTQTQASWYVTDVRAEVAELRARGVKVEDCDLPGLKTEDGIADIGFAWAAWATSSQVSSPLPTQGGASRRCWTSARRNNPSYTRRNRQRNAR